MGRAEVGAGNGGDVGYPDLEPLEKPGAVNDGAGTKCQISWLTCLPEPCRHIGRLAGAA